MATENTTANVNGMYGGHPNYSMPEQSQLSSSSQASEHPEAPSAYGNGNAGSEPAATAKPAKKLDVSKDEVGWYFVEQYYTTLSKHPEKLHVSSSRTPSTPHLLTTLAVLWEAISVLVRPGS